jgi:hypothetical protein
VKRAISRSALAVLAFVLGSCSMFDYSRIVSHKYALVYGVTRYTMDLAGPNLQYPHVDAISVASVLQANGYTVTSRWVDAAGFVWTNGTSTLKQIGTPITTSQDGSTYSGAGLGDAAAPSKQNILTDLQGLSGTLGPDDVLVIYFSGHGTQDTSMTPPREYFDPYASVLNDGAGNFYDYPAPSIRDDQLASAFAAIKTPRKVLILDTCNSGGFIGNRLEVDTTPPAYTGGWPLVTPGTLIQAISNYASMQSSPTGLSPYGAQVLSAAGRDESSYETSGLGHGVMTYYLLQGLDGPQADLNHDGHVTVLEAFSYAKAGIDQNWNKDPGIIAAGQTFEPHVSGGPVDFVLF